VVIAVGTLAAVGSLAALFISETGSLFGFSEDGYRAAIVAAIVAEAATVLLLGPVVVGSLVGLRAATRRGRAPARPGQSLRAV
jgi:hypothetical protein